MAADGGVSNQQQKLGANLLLFETQKNVLTITKLSKTVETCAYTGKELPPFSSGGKITKSRWSKNDWKEKRCDVIWLEGRLNGNKLFVFRGSCCAYSTVLHNIHGFCSPMMPRINDFLFCFVLFCFVLGGGLIIIYFNNCSGVSNSAREPSGPA